jgi:Tol biopolymer transport system component
MRKTAAMVLTLLALLPAISFAKSQVETEHYVVVFDDGNEFYANEVIKVAEEIWSDLASAYNIYNKYKKIYIYIVDPGDYANGLAMANKNCVNIYTTNLNMGIRGTSNWIRNVVTHELAHVFSIKAALKNTLVGNFSFQYNTRFQNPDWNVETGYSNFLAPDWWVEGMAQYEAFRNRNDFWDTHRDMFLRMAVLENDLLNYVEMGTYGNRNGFYEEMVYNQGYALVLYLDSMYGANNVHQTAKSKSYFTFNSSLKKSTGKSGEELYNQWKKSLGDKYGKVAAAVRADEHEGNRIYDGGFWDEFPAISPQGDAMAFVSNKGYDVTYTHLFVMDMRTKTVHRLLKERQSVDSRVQWFPDGNRLLYSRWSEHAPYLDIYTYDLARDVEQPLTWHARAMDPSVSPDGKQIVYVENKSGIQNLMLIQADGKNPRQITNFANGTQLFSPCWTPDCRNIVIGIFHDKDRDIAMVSAGASPLDKERKLTDSVFFPESLNYQKDLDLRLLVHTGADERDPCLSPDGATLYFSSDRTGIFNIYRMDMASGKVEQVTNTLGGAFEPSVDPKNADVFYAGFHAANYSLYSIAAKGFRDVTLSNVERDYSARERKPYLFSAGPDDGQNRLKPYQYRLSPYEPVYTMWDVSPFISLSPAYITDSIGENMLRGGMNFLLGELSGIANLRGYVYAGRSLKNRPGISWGSGLASNVILPKLSGENYDLKPLCNLLAERQVIRLDDRLNPEPITADRAPYQSWLIRNGSTSGPDTLIGQYVDYSGGSMRLTQTFDDAGIVAGIQFDRRNSLNADLFMQNIDASLDILDTRLGARMRVYSMPEPGSTTNARDITNDILNDTNARDLVDFLEQGTITLNPSSLLNYYDHYAIYKDYQAGLTYSYENIRPAQLMVSRADLFSARYALASSVFSVGGVYAAGDTSYSAGGATDPTFIYSRTIDGKPIPFVEPLLQRESYSRIELSGVDRFPLFGKRHLGTIVALFGTLDRKLPGGSTYPLEYRSSIYMSAYPYSFDPIDTGAVADSIAVNDANTGDTIYLKTSTAHSDKIPNDLLWGNRIMYLRGEYTFEAARGITFKPLGLLLQGIYLTAFAEAAGLWNTDLLDFSLADFLGTNGDIELSQLGKSYLKDAGLRFETPFVLFENWRGFFSFTWARRWSLDDKILGFDASGQVRHLDKNRFSCIFTIFN